VNSLNASTLLICASGPEGITGFSSSGPLGLVSMVSGSR
jgi:hypothetical protein